MELARTDNDHDAVENHPVRVDVDGITLELNHARPAGSGYIITLEQARAIADAWENVAPTGQIRSQSHAPALKAIVAAIATENSLDMDWWVSGEYAEEYDTTNCPFGITVRELPPVLDVVAVEVFGGYQVALDPMDDLQCDSCQ